LGRLSLVANLLKASGLNSLKRSPRLLRAYAVEHNKNHNKIHKNKNPTDQRQAGFLF
jgi:hypothetical protein